MHGRIWSSGLQRVDALLLALNADVSGQHRGAATPSKAVATLYRGVGKRNGERLERRLADEAEYAEVLRERFGIVLQSLFLG